MVFEKGYIFKISMKKIFVIIILTVATVNVWAQQTVKDSTKNVLVTKDPRIDVLGKKMAEYNESLSSKLHPVKGYRLMLLSTNDRAQALQVRSQLLQLFPDQSIYMIFQSPFIKLKFGNFLDKNEAEDYRKQVTALKIVPGNIYVVPEMVEVKADKIAAQQLDE